MNIYHIKQSANGGYDTWDSAIVVAETEDHARRISPDGDTWSDEMGCWIMSDGNKREWCSGWCSSIDSVSVELIGRARDGLWPGVVLASFNAG